MARQRIALSPGCQQSVDFLEAIRRTVRPVQRGVFFAPRVEDETFIFRRWVDFQFLVVSLRRLRLAALLAERSETNGAAIESAINEFDEALPDLRKMRNVREHIALDWLGGRLDANEALAAAEALHRAIKAAS
jgi:hypothetical protein